MGDTNLHVGRLPPGDWKQDGEGGRDEKRRVDKGEGKGRRKREEQWRSEGGAGGASAPGRRPEGGAKIMPKNFLKFIY